MTSFSTFDSTLQSSVTDPWHHQATRGPQLSELLEIPDYRRLDPLYHTKKNDMQPCSAAKSDTNTNEKLCWWNLGMPTEYSAVVFWNRIYFI